jgi:xanthine/CO dehydrogenase XdhC/CoxF family maturation factor
MTDIERILPLWRELESASAEYVLATVVAVEGSSYRKPGACMLLAPDGRRAGTVSGGCLEAEVARRAWWLTEHGPAVQRYSYVEDDGEMPYGSGCGGVLFLLLERRVTAGPLLQALEQAFIRRVPLAVATVLEGSQTGRRAFRGLDSDGAEWTADRSALQTLADDAWKLCSSAERTVLVDGEPARAWADFRTARPGLWIFGAGDDGIPLLALAKQLGWFVSLADGRAQLATRARFPHADALHVLPVKALPGAASEESRTAFAGLRPTDAAVLLTHSFEQDAHILATLLALPFPPAYIGVLGPQRRTRELLAEAALLLGVPATGAQIERWLGEIHAPMGLDLGADAPETIALSVIAEIQRALTGASALPLRQVRSIPLIPSS